MCVSMYTYMDAYGHIHIYIYTYIHIHIYIYIYTYTYTYVVNDTSVMYMYDVLRKPFQQHHHFDLELPRVSDVSFIFKPFRRPHMGFVLVTVLMINPACPNIYYIYCSIAIPRCLVEKTMQD